MGHATSAGAGAICTYSASIAGVLPIHDVAQAFWIGFIGAIGGLIAKACWGQITKLLKQK